MIRPRPAPSPLRARVRILFLGWTLLFLLVAGRVAYWQIARSEAMRNLAIRQHLDLLALPASRGRIYDRNGRQLATNVPVLSAYAVPRNIRDPQTFARRVAAVLHVPPERILERLAPDRYFVWIARHLTPQTAQRLQALGLAGQLGFEREEKRSYPLGPLAAQVLGFTGIDNQGLWGLEARYDAVLRGTPGQAVRVRDALGREILEGRRVLVAPRKGADLFLTLDAVVQHIAERELLEAVRAHGARAGVAVVMDVRSGELLAIANVPRFDPNRYAQAPPELWRNRAVMEVYEPGSTFKVLVMGAAMESGAVRPETTFYCPGFLRVPGGHRIREAQGEAHGEVRPADILRLSCNVGAALTAARLGPVGLYRAILRFGFGQPTGVELPGEAAGIVRPLTEWRGPDLYTLGFGQGIAVTPLQLLRAVAAIGNGGLLVRPTLISFLQGPDGRALELPRAPEPVRVLSPQTARRLLEMMVQAVVDGTGRAAAIEGYTVAGKTGTAQKPDPRGGYLPGKYMASFVGLVPASSPRLAILVLLDEPRGEYYGGVVGAPVFRRIASQVLWHLRIPPDGGPEVPESGPELRD
ncbi:MAG: penicillin-binding protein 2 [Armatimonadota bacterium]|nr:penicillin-binding protein 2 [Armatimonadota bacterium]MDR7439632.1 penicillin-binding protein 2 [Armatimonadota bacterium]MDR7563671.1 penicillin-binding protein 2 [Armatimonadota bacterium]MDR7566770.1 penicillin-binding protein 2 [Armatimonadota bacterium]MDR7601294.1 penicillin-binding protein 2 [Armatimonadota bacterium]